MIPYAGVRYDAAARHGHVESYFWKLNDPARPRALWLKATIFASNHDPRKAVSEAWAVAFDREAGHVAVKTWAPYARSPFSTVDLAATVDGSSFTRQATRGSITTGDRTIAWDLALESLSGPIFHLGKGLLYENAVPVFKVMSLTPDARFSGYVDVRGERWKVDAWPGMLGHNWGRRHSPSYVWAHCNLWNEKGEDGEVVFEGTSGRTPIGPLTAPTLTKLFFRHRGVRYDLSGSLDMVRIASEVSPRRWRFRGSNGLAKAEGELWGETDDFVGLYYANPDGTMTHCLNTKIAHAEISFTPKGRAPLRLTSQAAALEIGTLDPKHGVRMYV